ncbi:MAG TPA: DUF3822 family protein [Salinimicrobium catena]|uniref:DUF3822 family protein n=1 Tax=Salinimicrobium catena TaxID=390640 RepID=A0A7C2M3F7_9FLAO|nr:DUF3822 family protein [Salinimicrobium catena]
MGKQSKESHTNNIKLSIQVSLNGLSFCALSSSEERIIFFKEVSFTRKLNPSEVLQQIEKLYDQEDFLQSEKPEVTVQFSNELYTLVPEKYFDEKNASDYLKFNTRILETDYVAHDRIEGAGIINVFIPYTNINNFFFEKYGEFEYRHCITTLAENFLRENEPQDEVAKVYVNCYTRGYDLVVIKKGQLLLANSFTCHIKEDFIYYLLFTAEQLELDPNEFQLILLGKITANSDYYQIAYRYIKNIQFLETSFGYIFALKEQPPKGYMHYTLLKALQ